MLFKEDSMKIHQVQAATNWALLNTLGLNIFRGLGFLSITEGRRWLGNHWEKLVAIS
ncbi:transposase (fragment) [Planktothrix agardhii]